MIEFTIYVDQKGTARQYEESIKASYIEEAKGFSFGNKTVGVCVTVYISDSDKISTLKVEPGLMLISKALFAALSGIAFDNDKQVCLFEFSKVYTDEMFHIDVILFEF